MRIRKKIEELRMKKEAEQLLKEIEKYPELKDLQPPADLKERVYAEIERREKKLKESLTEEQQELIRMGIRYKKQQKSRKFIAVAVLVILLLSIGMTSLGGAEKVFYRISSMFMNRSKEIVDSSEVKIVGNNREEEIYAEIEEKFGIYPVKMGYKPEGAVLQEVTFFDDMPAIHLVYGEDTETKILCWIRPGYVEGSWSKDVEDELMLSYKAEANNVVVSVNKYRVNNNDIRWLVQFEYEKTHYSMYIMNIEQEEIDKFIYNLYFT